MLNIIIFSKDRAAQLDLLIRSIKKFWNNWECFSFNVLYTYSNEEYKKGYDITFSRHPEFNFILEKSFKSQLCDIIRSDKPYTVFFVDDNVFKEPFEINCQEFVKFTEYEEILSFTLRLGKNTTRCYTQKRESLPPDFISQDICLWNWVEACGPEWHYPMSVDGGFFRTEEIKNLAVGLEYQNPNTFEGTLANNPINRPLMVCPSRSVIFNVPANKVQTANGNECGDIPANYLNDMYLQGKRLSINNLVGYDNRAPHEEVKFILEDI